MMMFWMEMGELGVLVVLMDAVDCDARGEGRGR